MIGVATSVKSGSVVQVNVNGVIRGVQCARDLTVAIGDVVLVHRVGMLWVISSRLFAAATTGEAPLVDPALDPNPETYTGTLAILPVFTGTWRDAAWRDDTSAVQQGIRGGFGNATGVALYGDKPRSLTGATVTAARLEKLVRTGGPDASTASTAWLVTESVQPAGAPTLTSSSAGPLSVRGEEVQWTVPTAWAQAFVDGTAGGLALFDADGSPFVEYAGRTRFAAAFTLIIDWSRTV